MIVACAFLMSASFAFADIIGSVALDAFVSGSFEGEVKYTDGTRKLETDGGVSGFSAHVEFPFLIGLGASKIEQKFQDENLKWVKTKYEATMLDLFYSIDFLVKLELGVGVGNAKVTRSVGTVKFDKTGQAYRPFVNLGIPIMPLISLRFGYHNLISPKFELSNKDEIEIKGSVVSVGLGVGF